MKFLFEQKLYSHIRMYFVNLICSVGWKYIFILDIYTLVSLNSSLTFIIIIIWTHYYYYYILPFSVTFTQDIIIIIRSETLIKCWIFWDCRWYLWIYDYKLVGTASDEKGPVFTIYIFVGDGVGAVQKETSAYAPSFLPFLLLIFLRRLPLSEREKNKGQKKEEKWGIARP